MSKQPTFICKALLKRRGLPTPLHCAIHHPLGLACPEPEFVICSLCEGETFVDDAQFKPWSYVAASDDPYVSGDIVMGRINRIPCPGCNGYRPNGTSVLGPKGFHVDFSFNTAPEFIAKELNRLNTELHRFKSLVRRQAHATYVILSETEK